MKAFTVPTYETEPANLQPAYERFRKTMGFVPNLYATIGYSPNALNSYLQFTSDQTKGTFHAKEREAINLIISELNGCHYCLASHGVSAIRNGWTEADTLLLRAGTYPETKWQVIYQVIKSIIDHKGEVREPLMEEFFNLGYRESALVDLLALISVMSFTNYMYRMSRIPIDFPLAKDI